MLFGFLLALVLLKEPLHTLEQVRGQTLPPDLKVETLARDRIRPFLEQAIRDSYGDRFDDLVRLYQALHLLAPDQDARQALLDLYQSQVAAFYNPKDHTMKVIEGLDPDQPFLKIILVHELTHALQDRRLPLYRIMMERAGSRDQSLALQSLLEGEAVLVMTMAALNGEVADASQKPTERLETLEKGLSLYAQDLTGLVPDAPKFFVHDLLIPYQAGVRYVFDAYKKGGWKAVDALYKRLPCCMEEILHPEGAPACPSLKAGSARFKLPGYKARARDSFGETGFEYLFETHGEEGLAGAAAAGWDGDEVVLLSGRQGDVVAWFTRWDTVKDREEAVAAFQAYGKREGLRVRPVIGRRVALFLITPGPLPALPGSVFDLIQTLEESDEQSCPNS